MLTHDPSLPPEIRTTPALTPRERVAAEKAAMREALFEVCTASIGERGAKLTQLIEKIEEQDGPKAAADVIIRLLEFSTPKLQRLTVEDPDGNAAAMPTIHVHLAQPTPKVIDAPDL